MATDNDQARPAKNRWTRWYMWLMYGSFAFLVLVIILAVAGNASYEASTTPEERAEYAEATKEAKEAEKVAGREMREAEEASREQTKEAEDDARQQTKDTAELMKQQTKEARERAAGLGFEREEMAITLSAIIGDMVWQPPQVLQSGSLVIRGYSEKSELNVELAGSEDNLTAVTALFVSHDLVKTSTNFALFNRIVAEVIPEWEGGSDWVLSSLDRVIENGGKRETREGDVELYVSYAKEIPLFTLHIKAEE